MHKIYSHFFQQSLLNAGYIHVGGVSCCEGCSSSFLLHFSPHADMTIMAGVPAELHVLFFFPCCRKILNLVLVFLIVSMGDFSILMRVIIAFCRIELHEEYTYRRKHACPLGPLLGRVESPITKKVPISNHFPIASSFLNQIEQLLCHWMCKLERYKCSLSVRSKGATQKTQEEEK